MAQLPTVNGWGSVQPTDPSPVYQQDVSGLYGKTSPGAKTSALIAQGVNDVGDTLTKDYLQWQAQDNERQAKDLDVQYSDAIRQIQFGDGTADNTGYFGEKGQNALDKYQGSVKAIQETRQKMLQNISNPAVAKMFDSSSQVRAGSATGQMTEYSVQQRRVANLTASQSRQNSAIEDAVANPANIGLSFRVVDAETAYQAKLNGEDADMAKLHASQNRGAVLGATVENLAIDNPDQAVALFEANKDKIDPVSVVKLRKTLDDATMLSRAQKDADSILSQNLGFEASLAAARAIPNAKERDEARKEVTQRFSEVWTAQQHAWALQEHAEGQETKAALGQSQTAVDNLTAANTITDENGQHKFDLTGALDQVKDQDYTPKVRALVEAGLKSYADVQESAERRDQQQQAATVTELNRQLTLKNKEELAAYNDAMHDANSTILSGKSSLIAWQQANPDKNAIIIQHLGALEDLQKTELGYVQGKTSAQISDGETLRNILTQNDTPQLANFDLDTVKMKLTVPEQLKLQDAIISANTKIKAIQANSMEYYHQGASLLQQFAPKTLGWGSQKQSAANKQMQQDAIQQMDSYINRSTQQGKVPNTADIQKEAQRIMLPISKPGIIFDSALGVAGGNISNTDKAQAVVEYDNIPANILNQIKEALQKYGKDTEDKDLIEQIAGAYAVGDSARMTKLINGK